MESANRPLNRVQPLAFGSSERKFETHVPWTTTRPLAILWLLLSLTVTAGAEENGWRKLPWHGGRAERPSSLAVEGNTLWAIAGKRVAYWDGEVWHSPAGPKLVAGVYPVTLLGGTDRPVYCTQPGENDRHGTIYELKEGRAEFVTRFRNEGYDVSLARPGAGCGLYVSQSGLIANFSDGRLAVYVGKKWEERGAPDAAPLIIDVKHGLHFYYPSAQQLIRFDRATGYQERAVPLEFSEKRPGVMALYWGNDRVLVFECWRPRLQGFRLEDGQPIDLGAVNEKLGHSRIFDGFATRDRSVWLRIRAENSNSVYRIDAKGEVKSAEALADKDLAGLFMLRHPTSVLESASGSLWIGRRARPIARYDKQVLTVFGAETDDDLTSCNFLVEDQNGNIYAANAGGIYAYRASGASPPE